MTPSSILLRIIQLACLSVFIGRGWQHLVESVPYREVLWNEHLMKGIVEGWFGVSWSDYVTNLQLDRGITIFQRIVGVFFLLSAILLVFIKLFPRRLIKVVLFANAIWLAVLALLYFVEKGHFIGQFLEYSLQFLSPIFLYYLLFSNGQLSQRLLFFMKLAIAVTFTAHGLYAMGYYPRPGYFTEMTMVGFGFSEPAAIQFLYVVGVLDIIFSLLLFVPFRPVQHAALAYAVIWGFMTAVARIYTNFYIDFWWDSLVHWMPHTLYRLPHFLIPAAVWWGIVFYPKNNTLQNSAA